MCVCSPLLYLSHFIPASYISGETKKQQTKWYKKKIKTNKLNIYDLV